MRANKLTIKELMGRIQVQRKQTPFECIKCGDVLTGLIRDAWPNDEKEAWLYIECDKCGHANALYKVFHRQGILII